MGVAALLAAAVVGLSAATPAPSLRLADLDNCLVDPFQAPPDIKALVFSVELPVSNRYAPVVGRLHGTFAPKGVQFLLMYPNPYDTADAIRRHLKAFACPIRALRDPDHALAKLTNVSVTPEAAVCDRQSRELYHGRIDDRDVNLGLQRPAPTRHDLEDALSATLTGKTVAQTTTQARALQAPIVTFNNDIAPLVFERCATCHHPGGSAPFSVLTYASARQHANQIAAMTKSRVMPPWRAESDFGGFVGQHPLTDAEIDLLQQWVAEGAVEGDARDLPPAPAIAEGWQLGKPDLVVSLPVPYTLRAEGTDVFRAFVMTVPITGPRYVKGIEFRPGNPRVVHHANIRVDPTPTSRRLDDADPEPGYEGLIARTAGYPDGYFLGWTPGQVAPLLPKGLAWRLNPGTDLVVEIHMQPSGKPELVQPSIGFFFGPDPPERTPTMLRLGRQNIEIPAGEKNYTITDSFVLPVDVEVQAVQPHAHYLAHDVTGTATLPDGTTKTVIHVKDWDFRWQHVYRFVAPFTLPEGTTLAMRYTYDNSTDNPRNPSQPPRRVVWGQRTADEMGDMWFQVLTKDGRDRDTLIAHIRPKVVAEDIIGYERVLESEPESVSLHDDLAGMYLELGRADAGVAHFEASARLQPESAAAHFNLGLALMIAGKTDEAIAQYRQALDLKPEYVFAHNNLGAILLKRGNVDDALAHFREAVRLDPTYAEAQDNLGRVCRERGEEAEAIDHFRRAVLAKPSWATALADLAWMLATASDDLLRNPDLAVRLAARAADLTDRHHPAALDVLAAAYASTGDFDRAIATTEAALQLAPEGTSAADIRGRQQLYKQHTPYRRR